MPGVRLRHDTLRAGFDTTLTFVVELPKPYPQPKTCNNCGKFHDNKAIHFDIDTEGYTILNTVSWEKWKDHLQLAGFQVVNEVKNPPNLRIGAVDKDRSRIVRRQVNGQIDGAISIQPEMNQYQSRDKIWKPFTPIFEKALEEDDRKQMAKKREKRTIYKLNGGN
jgi:DNA-directed RNA polymerase subunit L